jgi:hypothetical protein
MEHGVPGQLLERDQRLCRGLAREPARGLRHQTALQSLPGVAKSPSPDNLAKVRIIRLRPGLTAVRRLT